MNRQQQPQPVRRLDDALDAGRARLHHCRERAEEAIRSQPLGWVASALAAGWLSGKLGLGRVAVSAVRSALPLAPSLLAALGAARAWECLQKPPRTPAAGPRSFAPEPPEQFRAI